MILEHIDEAVATGARQDEAANLLELDPRTLQRWRVRGLVLAAQGSRRSRET